MHRLVALTMVWALVAPLADAEPFDRLLTTPGTTQIPDGAALIYRHRSATGHGQGDQTAGERTIRLERRPGRAGVTATLEGDGARQLVAFRGTTGNPIALVFLDSVVSRISEASGGNPFYLRRRIKEAAREPLDGRPMTVTHGGSELSAEEVVLRPFEGTEHAAELGVFTTLELTFVLSDAVPGRFVSLRAMAGEGSGGYTEEVILDGTT